MGDFSTCSAIFIGIMVGMALMHLVRDFIMRKVTNKRISFVLVVLLTGVFSCLFPFFTWGLMFGLPSVLLNTALLTLFYKDGL